MVESYNPTGYGNAIDGENDDNAYCEGEHVDCRDTINKWCNAEVRKIEEGRVFVHYTGFVAKYDEWMDTAKSETCRIQKQWKRGRRFHPNNRIDVLDSMGKWLEATVVEIEEDEGNGFHQGVQRSIKVHFKGFTPKWDEVIRLDTDEGRKRVMEVGALSGAHGWAKYDQSFQIELQAHLKHI